MPSSGHSAAARRLAALADGDKFFHAYILEGGRGVDKTRAATRFAKAALCEGEAPKPCGVCASCVKADSGNHEDIIYVTRDGNSIGVKQILELQTRLRGKPFASERVVAVVDEADRMTPQSQNKLLKTLEEPSGGNIILLMTRVAASLLETVRSRCVIIRLEADGPDVFGESGADGLAAAFYEKLASGGAYYELSRIVGDVVERNASGDFLNALESRFRDALVSGSGGARGPGREDLLRFVDCLNDARRGAAVGFNIKYALKTMILDMRYET
jgi:DNA polymerase-3 subunit delta'